MTDTPDWMAEFISTERLPDDFAEALGTLYAPLAARIASANARHRRPVVVGICGPQASGKSTLCAVVARLLEAQGLKVAVVSLDDLYLTKAERQALAAQVHPLFAVRGPPGTHDVELGVQLLNALIKPGEVRIPRFDKATDDRKPEAEWDVVEGPMDVVLFEGWCVGARAQQPAALAEPVNDLERDEDPDAVWRTAVNDALRGPYQRLFAKANPLILLKAPDFETVVGWRQEQEAKLRDRLAETGGAGRAMTELEVARFVQLYERLTRHILSEMPTRSEVIRLGRQRNYLP